MILGLGNQQTGDQRADDGRQPDRGGGEAGADHDQQAGGEEQLRAFRSSRLREQAGQGDPPQHKQGKDDQPALPQRRQHSAPAFGLGIRGHRAEDEDDRDDHNILEQQHRQSGAANRGLGTRNRQDDRGRGESEREAKRHRAGPVLPHHGQHEGRDGAGDHQFERAQPEHQPPHLPQSLERQFQPDGEQQEDDPELRERFERLGVGNGYMRQPWPFEDEATEAVGTDRYSDENEADDRRDAETGEDRNDDPRRAEDHQRIGQNGG